MSKWPWTIIRAGATLGSVVKLRSAVVAVIVSLMFAACGEPRTGPVGGEQPPGWRSLGNAPITARSGHVAVWTGDEMLVFGGLNDNDTPQPPNLVGRYEPAGGKWSESKTKSPISGGGGAAAAWTGTEMLIWNGVEDQVPTKQAAAYNLHRDSWRELPHVDLSERGGVASAWTGKEFIVWGGVGSHGEGYANDGAAYDPQTNTWRKIAPSPLRPRAGFASVWTGSKLLVWGGVIFELHQPGECLADGAAYDPERNAWTLLPATPLSPRREATAVWTGKEMVIWGGACRVGLADEEQPHFDDGAALDPASGTWRSLPRSPLSARIDAPSVWTGNEMLIWGGLYAGVTASQAFGDGAAYSPEQDAWRPLPPAPIHTRTSHAVVWTNEEMIVWGGRTGDWRTSYADGAAYQPSGEVYPSPPSERDIEHFGPDAWMPECEGLGSPDRSTRQPGPGPAEPTCRADGDAVTRVPCGDPGQPPCSRPAPEP
jgi:N-acetylneuraminic acid mutarotase